MELNISDLSKIEKEVKKAARSLANEIAKYGLEEARKNFAEAEQYYDDGKVPFPPYSVYKKQCKGGYEIVAEGEGVAFLEFGAGVFYNGTEPYPDRPSNVKKIGEYGKGKGKQGAWYFYKDGDKNQKMYTFGTPALMPMYKARKAMIKKLEERADD